MIRRIIEINAEKCNGCGICIDACHEGAIQLIDGKATLISDEYCDGLGDCLPTCPTDAIKMIEREAKEYDDELVKATQAKKQQKHFQCPGSMEKKMTVDSKNMTNEFLPSQLSQWPIQLELVNPKAGFFDNCNLLIAADCTAFSYGNFHQDFIKNHVVLIACPKLDEMNTEKLTEILNSHTIQSLSVVRMEVPCCGGLTHVTETALNQSTQNLSLKVTTISLDGKIID